MFILVNAVSLCVRSRFQVSYIAFKKQIQVIVLKV